MITNAESAPRLSEIADGIYRISTPLSVVPGGFSFNQYLVVDEEPLLFHTGPRRMFPLVAEAIAAVLPVERLRWIAFSHFEADECGGAQRAASPPRRAPSPVCSQVAAMVSVEDFADRAPRRARRRRDASRSEATQVRWFDAPHLPHGWECGSPDGDDAPGRCFCGDLFTQGGHRRSAADGVRHPRAERGVPQGHGLLLALEERRPDPRNASRPTRADDARLHARQRLARGRRRS